MYDVDFSECSEFVATLIDMRQKISLTKKKVWNIFVAEIVSIFEGKKNRLKE